MDEDDGREFLQCEYNKDGDSYRSPWTNKYFPPVEADDDPDYQPIYPSQDLLEMEGKANDLFFRYCKLYYDSDFHSSVYFFDTDTANGFGSCWLIKKSKFQHYLIVSNIFIYLLQPRMTRMRESRRAAGTPCI